MVSQACYDLEGFRKILPGNLCISFCQAAAKTFVVIVDESKLCDSWDLSRSDVRSLLLGLRTKLQTGSVDSYLLVP